ncbi:hypothetical protein EKD04_003260 [Chloroflexales bacterium ZM16-3]|nr:hypothetical protein [Chloroflexales bacterium ZM16-3]
MTLLILMIIGGILLLFAVGWGVFWMLIQLGVIVQKATEPPTTDTNTYSLGQGRDVSNDE